MFLVRVSLLCLPGAGCWLLQRPQLELTWEESSGLNTPRTNAQPHHSMSPSPTCDGEGHGSSHSSPGESGKEHLYVQNVIKFLLKFKSRVYIRKQGIYNFQKDSMFNSANVLSLEGA